MLLLGSRALVLTRQPNKQKARFDGPYMVLQMMGPHNMSVELMDKAHNVHVVAIANVKPFRGDKDLR